jgi:hypothetical protein
MKYLIFAACLLLPASALADCHSVAKNDGQQLWQCDVPTLPPPPPARPKCQLMSGILICTAPIDKDTKPSNCNFGRDGKYVCWD